MADLPEELEEIVKHFPKFWGEAGHLFTTTLYESAKLDRKTIELILLALLAGRRWETGITVHTQAALDHGATPDGLCEQHAACCCRTRYRSPYRRGDARSGDHGGTAGRQVGRIALVLNGKLRQALGHGLREAGRHEGHRGARV